jgi:type I restriction enzyme S subunit
VDCLHATAPTQDEGYPLIRTPNIGRGRLILDGVQRVDEHTYQHWTRRAVPQQHDLILAREAPAGNVAIIKNGQTVCLGQRTVHLRPDAAQVDPDFLCYFLLHPKQQGLLLAGETGATSKHVNMRDIRRLPLQGMPHRDVQTRAGALLAAYDDLIENNTRRIKLLEDAARLLYEEWFVRLRFPGHEHTPIKDGVPEGWHHKLFSEVSETVGGGTPSTKVPEYWDGEITWVVPSDITRNDCLALLDSERHITDKGLRESSATLVPPETILMTSRASVGFFALVDREVCTNQGFINIIPHSNHIRMYLLFNLMNRVEEIRSNAKGTTYPEISKGRFRGMDVVVPSEPLTKAFSEAVYPMVRQVRCLKKQAVALRRARDVLLPRLMSGEVAV